MNDINSEQQTLIFKDNLDQTDSLVKSTNVPEAIDPSNFTKIGRKFTVNTSFRRQTLQYNPFTQENTLQPPELKRQLLHKFSKRKSS